MKRIRPIYTTGIFRVCATIQGQARNFLPAEIKAAGVEAWTYTTEDGNLYSIIRWEGAPVPAGVAGVMGYKDGFVGCMIQTTPLFLAVNRAPHGTKVGLSLQ